ncbi:MAG: hypothetical protein J7L51_00490 [Desulfurococcales archaeon]|nr:hypothetical protein [Desulfurococcales archaeon]
MKRQRSCEKRYVLVFNSSTIIVLRELGRVDLIDSIRRLGVAKIVVPQAVKEEFAASGTQIGIQSNDVAVSPDEVDVHSIDIPQSLGEGERQAIAIAYAISRSHSESVALVITDDLRARKTCKRMGIKVMGTLGLIEFAKKHGIITKEEALNLLERIPSTSLYVTREILKGARNKIMLQ